MQIKKMEFIIVMMNAMEQIALVIVLIINIILYLVKNVFIHVEKKVYFYMINTV